MERERVFDVGFIGDAALSAKAQLDAAPLDVSMPIAQCRQPEASVRPRILAVADPKKS
jgi:hypothetical protein